MGRTVVPPERVELSSLAPEASTLSTELQGLSKARIPRTARCDKKFTRRSSGQTTRPVIDYYNPEQEVI